MNTSTDRHPSSEARKALAQRFGLPFADGMQDWEWDVADTARFGEFLATYSEQELTTDERFSLMEVLVQCVEDMPTEEQFANAWRAIEPHLSSGMHIHWSTAKYWSCPAERDLDACFRVGPNMRRLLSIAGNPGT